MPFAHPRWATAREDDDMAGSARGGSFYGWRVAQAAFVLAAFGWGMGFFGLPVFLSVTVETSGWPLALVSTAVSVHFLAGAVTGANLPALHRRMGPAGATKTGAIALAVGIAGWATAASPWHLFLGAVLSGAGWGTMSAAALNAIVSPWFVRSRPAALALAYNGGSVGGIVFSPLWVAAIGALGFPAAACAVGAVMIVTMWTLADAVFSRTPERMGSRPDGDAPGAPADAPTPPAARPLPGSLLWHDFRFVTLCAGMALGLFAQIGLMAHLFSLLVPALGAQQAGLAMGLVTLMAIAGRTLTGWLTPPGGDRRLVACGCYTAQLAGSLAFVLAKGTSVPLLLAGIVLFGVCFGNATLLPPLIAQVEFAKADLQRAVALIVGTAQGGYAFAPATFGLLRELGLPATDLAPGEAPALFAAAALVQALAVGALLAGRGRRALVPGS
jgi:MFS family permease